MTALSHDSRLRRGGGDSASGSIVGRSLVVVDFPSPPHENVIGTKVLLLASRASGAMLCLGTQ
jgi:hypothetical protein